MTTVSPSTRHVLEAYRRALDREAHVLAADPALTWHQLCNRLQWSEPARELVDAEADRREAAGDPIWFRTRTPYREADVLVRTLRTGSISALAFSPDGARLATVGASVRLWDTQTGAELANAVDPGGPIVSCAFDCDGSYLVTGSRDGRVQIRDPLSLGSLVELPVAEGEAHCATSPVEPLAVVAAGTVLRVVELPSGRQRVSASADGGAFTCCGFSGDGEMIVTGDDAGVLRLWLTSTLDVCLRLTLEGSGRIEACSLSPNKAFIAAVPAAAKAVLLVGEPDETGKPHTATLSQMEKVNDCCVTPDGRWLVTASDDRMAWLRELEDMTRPMSALEGHGAPVELCTFAPNGSLLATAGRDGTVKLWDPWRGPSVGGIAGHHDRVTALAFAPDGSFLVSASADLTLKTWDPAPTSERSTLEGHLAPVWDCVVLRGSSLIASASSDGTIRLWDAASAKVARVLQVESLADVHALAYSPDGSLLAAGHDRSASVWDLATGERLREADVAEAGPGDRRVQDCAFTTDGSRLVLACEDATLRIWDVATLHESAVLRGHSDCVSCCAAVPESSLVVSGSRDGTLRLWDLDSGAELHVFAGHTDAVWDCAVSADGSVLVSAGWDGDLRVWDLPSRTPIAAYTLPVRLRAIALHPSLPRVALGDVDGWVRVVDLVGLHLDAPSPGEAAGSPPLELGEVADDRALAAARKRCTQCNEVVELLRFRCPHCASELFDVVSTGADYALVDAMQGRQKLSLQHVDQGSRLFQQGLLDEALQEFRQAIEADPWNATAHGNIGVVFLRRDEPAEALRWFERALEIDPGVAGAREMVAEVQRRLA